MATEYNSSKIVTDSLFFCTDAANTKSYSGSGTTWSDISGKGFTGTLTNMTASNHTSGVSGYFTFDGTNESVSFSGSAKVSIPPLTISAWIKRDGNQDSWASPITGRQTSPSSHCFNFNVYNNDELRHNWENQSASWNYDASITIPNNEWVMCAVSVTSSAATLYMFKLDGTISSATNTTTHNSGTFPYDAAGEFNIGQDNNGGSRYFDGDVSMGLVYSRALSQTELKQNFDATKHRYE